MTKRYPELNFCRVIAMFAVIMIHVSSGYIFGESGFAVLGLNLAYYLNQFSRFAVPMFVMLSGCSLGLSKEAGWLGFQRKRLLRILPPYIIWSFVYYLSREGYSFGRLSAGQFLSGLPVGQFASHLYFIVIIIQLYLLFPPLRRLCAKWPWRTLICSAGITLWFTAAIYLNISGIKVLPEGMLGYAWLLFPTWIFYFALGLCLTRERLDKLLLFAHVNLPFTAALTVAAAFLYTQSSRVMGLYELSIRAELFAFVPLCFMTLSGIAGFVTRNEFAAKASAYLSRLSFGVYFCHVLILTFVRGLGILPGGTAGMALCYVIVAAVSVACCAGYDWVAGRVIPMLKKVRG